VSNTREGIETIARSLCEARWGKGSWENGKVNRAYWRRQARKKDTTNESRSS
jgi:hypothetical protein